MAKQTLQRVSLQVLTVIFSPLIWSASSHTFETRVRESAHMLWLKDVVSFSTHQNLWGFYQPLRLFLPRVQLCLREMIVSAIYVKSTEHVMTINLCERLAHSQRSKLQKVKTSEGQWTNETYCWIHSDVFGLRWIILFSVCFRCVPLIPSDGETYFYHLLYTEHQGLY